MEVWPIAIDVAHSVVLCVCMFVCLSVCVLGTSVSCAETVEPIVMPFGRLTHVGSRNHVLDEGPDLPMQRATVEG